MTIIIFLTASRLQQYGVSVGDNLLRKAAFEFDNYSPLFTSDIGFVIGNEKYNRSVNFVKSLK